MTPVLYVVEVIAPVRLEPGYLHTRRGAFMAIRYIDEQLQVFGYVPSLVGRDAALTLTTVRRDRTGRVRVVKRYRVSSAS